MENKSENRKVALYCRVSKTDGSQTTENQKISLLKYAELNALQFDLFEEEETTRKTRPIMQDVLTLVRQGVYTSLIVYKLDRWGRSLTELVLTVKEILDKEINFISISESLDFSTASGRLQFHILCAFAEYERSIIRERTLMGLERAKSQGKQLGRRKGSADKKKRSNKGYIRRMQTNPPPNNSKAKK